MKAHCADPHTTTIKIGRDQPHAQGEYRKPTEVDAHGNPIDTSNRNTPAVKAGNLHVLLNPCCLPRLRNTIWTKSQKQLLQRQVDGVRCGPLVAARAVHQTFATGPAQSQISDLRPRERPVLTLSANTGPNSQVKLPLLSVLLRDRRYLRRLPAQAPRGWHLLPLQYAG